MHIFKQPKQKNNNSRYPIPRPTILGFHAVHGLMDIKFHINPLAVDLKISRMLSTMQRYIHAAHGHIIMHSFTLFSQAKYCA